VYAGRVGQLLLGEASCLSCLPKLGSDHADKLDGVKASGDKTIVYKHLTDVGDISDIHALACAPRTSRYLP